MTQPRYWFPAKRFGWGWGFPSSWQGRLVLGVWLVAVLVGARLIIPQSPAKFAAFVAGMAALLTLICYLTGEPPKRRWGDKKPGDGAA
jgi:hypothetical protein